MQGMGLKIPAGFFCLTLQASHFWRTNTFLTPSKAFPEALTADVSRNGSSPME